MKKLLSAVIVAAMLLSLIAVIAVVPAAAVDGMWHVYSVAGDYYLDDKEDDEFAAVPGYEYTDEGLKIIPPVWEDTNPKLGVQTKDPVDLKDGVYFEVRIDDFTYSGDKWFCINITDKMYCSPGSKNTEKYGEGMQTLIRPNDEGKIANVSWQYGAFLGGASTAMTATDDEKYDENGKPILALTVTWDGESYAMDINGAPASEATIAYMNEHFANGEGYVGINLMNGNKGGTAACTVLKFGTSKEDATAPSGDDYADPQASKRIPIAPIADPNTVEAGKPAIFMNGSRDLSDVKNSTGRSGTGNTKLNEDGTFHYVANSARAELGFSPKNEISYDIDDFPVIMVLTKNFCTCDDPEECMAFESANMYVITGEYIAADDAHKVNEIDMCYDPIKKGEDSYIYFYVDMSTVDKWDAEGRFNGARFDVNGILFDTPGRNAFDVCFMALFRTVEEGEAFVMDWIGVEADTGDGDGDGDDTEAPGSSNETDAPDGGNETDAPGGGNETDAPGGGNETDKPGSGNDNEDNDNKNDGTNAPDKGDDKDTSDKGGCGSVAGFGTIVMITLAAGFGVSVFKRRRK